MNSKQKMFYPLVAKNGGMGLLTVGEDGTLLSMLKRVIL